MSQLILFGLPPLPEAVGPQLARDFGAYLSSALDNPVEVRLYANYSELADHLAEGQLDFAWLPPLPAAGLRRHCGALVLAHAVRSGLHAYYSVLFTRADSPIREPADLRGKKLAYVHRRSASGFMVAAATLAEQGIRPKSPPAFLKSHAKVVQAVIDGQVDAGATFCSFRGDPADRDVEAAGWIQSDADTPMHIVLCTDPIPADVICAWPGTTLSQRGAMTLVLIGMVNDSEGKALLGTVFGADLFDEADAAGLDRFDLALDSPDLRLQSAGGSE